MKKNSIRIPFLDGRITNVNTVTSAHIKKQLKQPRKQAIN
jgi:hypothetical protein